MATNGDDARLAQLAEQLRGAAPPVVTEAEGPYDLAARASDTAKALRDLGRYSNEVANDLDRIVAAYIGNMHRLMGKLGK